MAQASLDFTINAKINKTEFDKLKSEIQSLKNLSERDLINIGSAKSFDEAKIQLQSIQNSATQVEAALNKAFSVKLGTASLSKFNNELKGLDLKGIAEDFNKAGAAGTAAFNNLAASVLTTKTQVKETNKWLDEIGKTMSNTIKWGLSSSAWNTITGTFQKAYNYTKDLDRSLNDIRIVSEKSADEMTRFAVQANKAAKNLGATTLDYTNAALIYYQQGLSEEEVTERTNTTIKMANTLQASASEVSDYMTAIWNNFDDGSHTVEYYADVLAKLGAATASSAEEISTGLEKFAAVADTVGLSYEYATSALTTITANTRQSAEVVGTALKTLFARIQDLELGETLDDGTTLGKYSEALEKVGINIKDTNGELKDMDDILDEMGSKWGTLTKAQQVSLAQTVAGVRQYTQLVSLMDSWADFENNVSLAENATGELNKQQEIYLESTQAHLDQLTASAQRLYSDLIDSKGVNSLIDVFSTLVTGVSEFTEAIGGSGAALSQIGSLLLRVLGKNISQSLATTISNLKGIGDKAKDVNAQFQLMQQFKGISINSQAYNQLLKMTEGLNQYRSVLTESQIEEANAAILRRNELANDVEKWDEARKEAEQYFSLIAENGSTIDLSFTINKTQQEDILGEVDSFLAKYKKKADSAKNYFNKIFSSGQLSWDQDQRDKFITDIENLLKPGVINNSDIRASLEEGLNNYRNFIEKYPAITKDAVDENGKIIGKIEFFDDDQEELLQDFEEAYSKAIDHVVKNSKQLKEAVNTAASGAGEGLTNAVSDADKEWQDLESRFRTQTIVNSVVNISSAVMQLGTAISAIGNISDIWYDDSLSDGEKVLQIMISLASVVGGFAQTFVVAKNAVEGLKVAFFKSAGGSATYGAALKGVEKASEDAKIDQEALLKLYDVHQKESAESSQSAVRELGYIEALAKGYRTLSAAIAESNFVKQEANEGLFFNKGDFEDIQSDVDAFVEKDFNKKVKNAMKKIDIVEIKEDEKLSSDTVGDLVKQGVLNKKEAKKQSPGQLSLMKEIDAQAVLDEAVKAANSKDAADGLEEIAEAAQKTGEAFGNDSKGSVGKGLKGAVEKVGGLLTKVPGWGWAAAAGLAVLTIAIYAGVKAWNADANAAKEAAKAAQEAQETYENLKSKAEELNTTISSYNEAIDTMSELTKGTEEYTTALKEANEEAIKLLEAYNLFGQYTIKDGIITIDPEALETLQKVTDQRVLDAENTSYAAKVVANETSDISKATNLRRKIGSVVGTGEYYHDDEDGVEKTRQFSNEELEKTAEALNKLRGAAEEEFKTAITSDEAFKATLSTLEGVPQVVLDNIDSIVKNREAIIDFTDSLYDSSEANKFYAKQIYQNIVEEKYGAKISEIATNSEGNINESRAAQISAIIAETEDEATEGMNEELEDVNNKLKEKKYTSNNALNKNYGYNIENDVDLAKTYLKEIGGYSDDEIEDLTFDDQIGKSTVKDDAGNKVLDEKNDKEMRKALALKKLREDIEDNYTSDLDAEDQLDAISKLINATDSKLGEGFSDAILNSLASEDKKIDFSEFYGLLSPEEAVDWQEAALADDGKADPETLLKKLGLDEQTIKDAGFTSAEQFALNFAEGLSTYQWDKEAALAAAMNEQSSQIEEYDLDSEAVEEYASHLMDIAEASEEVDDGLETNAKTAVKIATILTRANEGLDNLVDGFEDWKDVLNNASQESQEYSEALADMKSALADVFGVTANDIDSDFITDNLALIEEAANGSEEALVELQKKLTQDIIMDITVDNTLGDDVKNKVLQLSEEIQNALSGFDIGDINSADFMTACEDIIKSANMTAEQAQAYFSSMGLSVNFKTEEKTVTTKKPKTLTTRTVKRTEKGVPVEWEESSKITGYDEVEEVIQVPAFSTNGEEPVIESISYTGGVKNLNLNSAKNSAGSSSSSKAKTEEKIEGDLDRYHDVDVKLKQVSNSMEKLTSQEDKFVGQAKIDNLTEQFKLLNQEIETTYEKLDIAKDEMGELQGILSQSGVQFAADGTISNYAAVYQSQLDAVNAVVDRYNSMSADQQENYQDTLDAAKEKWEQFKEDLSRYDEVITELIPGLEQDIQDAIDEQIEIKIEAFNMEIEITLDLDDARKTWEEFKRDVIDQIEDDDILGNATYNLESLNRYYDKQGLGKIQEETKYLNELLNELKTMDATGSADSYGDNRSQALEDLQEYYEQTMSDLTDIEDIIDDIEDSLKETLEDISDQMEDQLKAYEQLSDTLDHDMKLIQLVFGEDSYSKLEDYYAKKEENFNSRLDFQKQQVEFWEQQMEALEEGSEAWETARDEWESAVNEWQANVESAIDNLQEKYLNAINAIFENLNDKLTNGEGLSYLNEEWELINKNADRYLDTINAQYGIQTLQQKYLDAIDSMDNVASQKKLTNLMNLQVEALEQQDKLSQADLDRADLKYQIAVKQLQLEEAQQNKSTMRLRRDSQGNYSYQYTADEDEISKLQEELSNLYNQLYNFDKDQYISNLDEMYSIWTEYQQKMTEALQINDPEEREAKKLLITQQYEELINGVVKDNEKIKRDLYESTFLELADLYDEDFAKYATLAEAEQEVLMDQMIPQWNEGMQQMIDAFAKEGGFIPTCEDALDQLSDATKQYEQDLEELQEVSGVSFEDVANNIDPVIEKTSQLIQDNGDLFDSYQDQVAAINSVLDALKDLTTGYEDIRNAALEATEASYKYWEEQQRQAQAAAAENDAAKMAEESKTSSSSASSSSSSSSSTSNPYASYRLGGQTYTIRSGDTLWSIAQARYGSSGLWSEIWNNNRNTLRSGNPNLIYPGEVIRLDTGGYTGEWGDSDGRLALLHQKELVLNAQDTENILGAISMMRNMLSNIGTQKIGLSALDNSNGPLEQNVHIEANFPNVSSTYEIESALTNLVNAATQHIHKNK